MANLDLSHAFEAQRTIQDRAQIPTSKSIRKKCLACSGDSWREVQLCQVFECPLWLCRFGKRPATVLQKSTKWLDPVYVAVEGKKQTLRECGVTEWINPLTNARESLCSPTDPALIESCLDEADGTTSESS